MDAEQVKRNSFMNPAKVEYALVVFWQKDIGYTIELKALNRDEFKLFANQVAVKK